MEISFGPTRLSFTAVCEVGFCEVGRGDERKRKRGDVGGWFVLFVGTAPRLTLSPLQGEWASGNSRIMSGKKGVQVHFSILIKSRKLSG